MANYLWLGLNLEEENTSLNRSSLFKNESLKPEGSNLLFMFYNLSR